MLVNKTFTRKVAPPLPTDQGAESFGIGTSRSVRHKLVIGGVEFPSYKNWTKTLTTHGAGSDLSVTLLTHSLPVDLYAESMRLSKDHTSPVTVDVFTSISVEGKVIFDNACEFSGVLTNISESMRAGTTVITAQSYAQILLNAKVNEVISSPAAQAMTTQQAVKHLVNKYGMGLKCVVDPSFDTPVGQIYKETYTKVITNVSPWEVIQSFALRDKADLFVIGDTLYYVRPAPDTSVSVTQLTGVKPNLVYTWGVNIVDAQINHAPLFAHNVSVTVKSVVPRTGQENQATVTMSDLKVKNLARQLEMNENVVSAQHDASVNKYLNRHHPASNVTLKNAKVGNTANYTFNIPNGTPEDCDRIAQQIAADIARVEFQVTLHVLGRPDLDPRQYVALRNMSSPVLDQVYAIKSIQISSTPPEKDEESDDGGYTAVVDLLNHSVPDVGATFGG